MKKKISILLLLLLLISKLFSQDFGEQQIISENANGARCVFSIDLDGDGDNDIISASWEDNKVVWYKNEENVFSEEQIITTNVNGILFIYSIDLDGDEDNDIISVSRLDNKIAWYENDGDGNFSSEIIINYNVESPRSVYAIDLDNDGDNDILSASMLDNKVAWYENDGQGNFSSQKIITTNVNSPYFVTSVDLDNDNDNDVIFSSYGNSKTSYFLNDGNGNFSNETVITESSSSEMKSIFLTDLDQDGDKDLLWASTFDSRISWFENDGDANFGTAQLISMTGLDKAKFIYSNDFDKDGDNDIVVVFRDNGDKIAWYENFGNTNFGNMQIITENVNFPYYVFAKDIDNDGDEDLLSASSSDNKIAWYENNINPKNIIIENINSAGVGMEIDIPISVTGVLYENDNYFSYRFKFHYDSEKLEYISSNLNNTISPEGSIEITNENENELDIYCYYSGVLTGQGDLMKIRFKIIEEGTSDLEITDFFFNDVIEPENIINTSLSAIYADLGDVNADNEITNSDAEHILKRSINIGDLVWNEWRDSIANLDGDTIISANDAANILRKIAISDYEFPVENGEIIIDDTSSIEVETIDNEIIFKSKGNLFALNVFLIENTTNAILNEINVTASMPLVSKNNDVNNFSFGVASPMFIAEGVEIARVSYEGVEFDGNLKFKIIANNHVFERNFDISDVTISVDSINSEMIETIVGMEIEIPIFTTNIIENNDFKSYSFKLNYDDSKLEYKGGSIENTISEEGIIEINDNIQNELTIQYTKIYNLTGEGELLKLNFFIKEEGISELNISDFLFNNLVEPKNIINNQIKSVECDYGDVNADGIIDDEDAKYALEYSLGLDPLSDEDPIPWDEWRQIVADVDNLENITANDASYILKKAMGFINEFPIENNENNNETAGVIIQKEIDKNEATFISTGNLIAFNLHLIKNTADGSIIDAPEILVNVNEALTKFNPDNNNYAIGIAATMPFPEGTELAKIVFHNPNNSYGTLRFRILANDNLSEELLLVSEEDAIEDINNLNKILIFPNPADKILKFKNLKNNSDIYIVDLLGKIIFHKNNHFFNDFKIDISNLEKGVYFIKINKKADILLRKKILIF